MRAVDDNAPDHGGRISVKPSYGFVLTMLILAFELAGVNSPAASKSPADCWPSEIAGAPSRTTSTRLRTISSISGIV